jgi:hypothetical protein
LDEDPEYGGILKKETIDRERCRKVALLFAKPDLFGSLRLKTEFRILRLILSSLQI